MRNLEFSLHLLMVSASAALTLLKRCESLMEDSHLVSVILKSSVFFFFFPLFFLPQSNLSQIYHLILWDFSFLEVSTI